MKRQKIFTVNGEKIKIVSTICKGPCVRTTINESKFFASFEIMKNYGVTSNHEAAYEEFIKRAMDKAYVEWVRTINGM